MVTHKSALIMRHRTLGDLVTELRNRLGFVGQGSSAGYNKPVMVSFLQEANNYVASELGGPTTSKKRAIINLEIGSKFYDYNNDAEDEPIDPGLVESMYIMRTPEDRQRLIQGIHEHHRQFTQRGQPTRYDTLNGQIELWPVPDDHYGLVIEYIGGKPRFTQDSDRTAVPSELVLLYAIAVAKAHYSQSDAQAALSSFNRVLSKEKEKQHQNRRYIVHGNRNHEDTNTVIGSNGNYAFYPGR